MKQNPGTLAKLPALPSRASCSHVHAATAARDGGKMAGPAGHTSSKAS